ncbi:MAG: META domain-containing protein [Caldilineaceae bacterium]
MLSNRLGLPLIILVMIILVGCQPVTAPTPVPESDGASIPLVGTEWLLDQMQGQQLVHDATVTARFSDDGMLMGRAGCNDYATTYTVDGADLTIDPNFDSGMEVCGEVWMTVESVYLASLQQVASYEIQGAVLFMRNGDGTVTLVFGVGSQ